MSNRAQRRHQERIQKKQQKSPEFLSAGGVDNPNPDIEYREFIGIYDNSVPPSVCETFVRGYDEAVEKRTIIDPNPHGPLDKKDDAHYIWPLSSTIYPQPPVQEYFECLKNCFQHYMERYSFDFYGPIFNDVFKIHKVQETEGYHMWHYENNKAEQMDRILVYMTYLQVPEEGGETEFLHQSMRINPIVGRTLIWPAYFTHMHRGNAPLKGEKMYVTGWFSGGRMLNDVPGK